MKKALSVTLALVMCLALVPLTAMAYGNQWIQMEKSNYDPNEEFEVTVSGIDAGWLVNWAKVGIYPRGADAGAGGQDHQITEAPTETFRFCADPESGDYEVRLYSNGYEFEIFTSVPFTVGRVAQVGNIALDRTAYTAFTPITVTVTGITEQMVTSRAFVGIYKGSVLYRNYGFDYVGLGSSTKTFTAPNENGNFEMRLYSVDGDYDNSLVMSVPFTVSGATGDDWAQDGLERANELGLIPDCLRGQDLTRFITRAEFAAVGVKLYERLTDNTLSVPSTNPFTDTNDPEVLKAFSVGIVSGVGGTTLYEPNAYISREGMAHLLTNVLKVAYIQGCTTPNNYTLVFTMPDLFADDGDISSWARNSVYYMAANGVISGVGNNMFAPRATTPAQEAVNYALAMRQHALIMAVNMADILTGVELRYTQN